MAAGTLGQAAGTGIRVDADSAGHDLDSGGESCAEALQESERLLGGVALAEQFDVDDFVLVANVDRDLVAASTGADRGAVTTGIEVEADVGFGLHFAAASSAAFDDLHAFRQCVVAAGEDGHSSCRADRLAARFIELGHDATLANLDAKDDVALAFLRGNDEIVRARLQVEANGRLCFNGRGSEESGDAKCEHGSADGKEQAVHGSPLQAGQDQG